MKIKGLLLGMMTCAALAACSNEDIVENEGGGQFNGKEAYVSVNIVTPAAAGSRAASDFEDGDAKEHAVSSATFLFFDNAGNSCAAPVVKTDLQWEASTAEGVTKISIPVLVLNPVNGVIPASAVAVLNSSFDFTGKSLSQVKDLAGAYTTGFVMSNSVYTQNNQAVVEIPLTALNVSTDPDKALENPVTIPVERVVAKVGLVGNSLGVTSDEQTIKLDNNQEIKVKAVIKGWKVTATNPSSYLLKRVDPTWSLGFNWNDAANSRSYWATSATPAAYTYYSYEDAAANVTGNVTTEYCLENTSATKSMVWVVAELQNVADNKPVSFVEWRGAKYSEGGLTKSIASMLKKYYYVKTGTANTEGATYETILPTDLELVAGSVHYKTKAALKTGKEFYTIEFNADGSVKTATLATTTLTDEIAALPEALFWKDGKTYYYKDIEHATIAANNKLAGIVRNHVYKLTINSIAGLGTPVYNPEEVIVPTKPTPDDASYVAANVEVLKWKIVTQTVDFN